jgi:hypothetical protein
VLSKLGCSGVKLYSTKMAMSLTSFVLVFSPSPTVKRRLGIQKEVAVSDLSEFNNTLELEEEIPPNQASQRNATTWPISVFESRSSLG